MLRHQKREKGNILEILGKIISDKTAGIICAIEGQLHRPVKYAFTDPKKTQSFGQCDFNQPDAYYVYAKQALLNITKAKQINGPFEVNLLHELSHLCQIEENFPRTCPIPGSGLTVNIALDIVGSCVSSCVLDLNVDSRLKAMGYSSDYFHRNRVNRAIKYARRRTIISGQQQIIITALQLMCLNVLYSGADLDELMSLYLTEYKQIFNCVREISAEIRAIGYDTADNAFRCFAFLFDAFNLFQTHAILYSDHCYSDISSVKRDFPGIHTLE